MLVTRRGSAAAAGLVAVAALLLWAVAIGAVSSPAGPLSVPSSAAAWQAVFEVVVGILGGGAVAVGLAMAVAVFHRPRRRRPGPEGLGWFLDQPPLPWWVKALLILVPVLILGMLVAAVIWLTFHPQPFHPRPPGVGGSPSSPGGRQQAAAGAGSGAPLGLWVGALVGALLVVALLGGLLLASRRRLVPIEVQPSERSAPAPVQAVDAALVALDSESDPRRAVIAAYLVMERLLARVGSPRRASDAPIEHLERSLVHLGAGRHAARRLVELFERARFSLHAIDEPVRRAAFDALAAVRRDLELTGTGR